jgi:hypothetical protein
MPPQSQEMKWTDPGACTCDYGPPQLAFTRLCAEVAIDERQIICQWRADIYNAVYPGFLLPGEVTAVCP